jgi:hypothetical protein
MPGLYELAYGAGDLMMALKWRIAWLARSRRAPGSLALAIVVAIGAGACAIRAARGRPAAGADGDLDARYLAAVRNAATVSAADVVHDLIAIDRADDRLVWSRDRSRLLVVTWKSRESYDQFIAPANRSPNSESRVIWVTAAPQVQRFCREYRREHPGASADAVALRLKQYLGLNPTWRYDVFVELWVRPDDLFRPCVDPETSDSSCELEFRTPPPVVKGIANYAAFYEHLYFADFRTRPGIPWTGLGYTYDWGNPRTREGASEFIVSPGSPYEAGAPVPTADYCEPGGLTSGTLSGFLDESMVPPVAAASLTLLISLILISVGIRLPTRAG